MGQLADEPKGTKEMESDCLKWIQCVLACTTEAEIVHFQTKLISHLAELSGYQIDIEKREEICNQLIKDRKERGIAGCRDCSYACIYSGKVGLKPQTLFMDNFDDSIEAFLNCK